MIFKHKNPDVTQITVRGIEANFLNGICETENPNLIEILKNSPEISIVKEPKVTKDK